MPKKQYSLPENLGQLEVSWNAWQTKYEVKLNGQILGELSGKEAVKGKDLSLPDGSILNVKMARVFLTQELRVLRNGQPLPGSASHPSQLINYAKNAAYFVGGLSLLLGLLAVLVPLQTLLDAGIGIPTAVEGAVFLILGYFISKNKAWAAIIAAVLLILDTLVYVIVVANSSADAAGIVVPLLVKTVLIIYLFRGYFAIRRPRNGLTNGS